MERLLVKFGGKFWVSKYVGANADFLMNKLRSDSDSIHILFQQTIPPHDAGDWSDFDFDYIED